VTAAQPIGIRNLAVANALLALWFAWRMAGALAGGSAGVAALQTVPLLVLLATGPLLLWRRPAVHRLAVAAALLGIVWVATVAFVQLAMRGLWDISPEAIAGIALAIYLVGVHGYLRHPRVRDYFHAIATQR